MIIFENLGFVLNLQLRKSFGKILFLNHAIIIIYQTNSVMQNLNLIFECKICMSGCKMVLVTCCNVENV